MEQDFHIYHYFCVTPNYLLYLGSLLFINVSMIVKLSLCVQEELLTSLGSTPVVILSKNDRIRSQDQKEYFDTD